ncbi:ComF family protein [Solibacillus sp. FSL H8-0538]|uniref:ComF family protein n=1 Tax=Solibacillus sp. FSL H8-0538 TaxID=2921400 RepID=UPI0030F52C58
MKQAVTNCLLCGRELQGVISWTAIFSKQLPQTICTRCEGRFTKIVDQKEVGVVSLYEYNDAMKDYLHRYKFMHDIVLAKVFNRELNKQLVHQAATIIPVPMHEDNLNNRTFAHLDELLHAAKLPFEQLLYKTTTETQVGKTREQRICSEQLFQVIDNRKIINNNFIIVDDIYTTGTTMAHAKRALLEAGAQAVEGFTLIRG